MASATARRLAAVAVLAVAQACQAPREASSDASRIERLTETFFSLCPIDSSAPDFQQAIFELRAREGVVVTQAGGQGSSYEVNWNGEVIDVAFIETSAMTLCGMRFRPAPLLTNSISSRLGHEPARDAGDGLVSWSVSDDRFASVEYQNLAARGIAYRPASPAERAMGINIGFGDSIMLIHMKTPPPELAVDPGGR